MHCSDEQLLAHLDGELSPLTRLRVERHLRSCWRCRTRRSACEQEIQKLTVAVDEWPFPEPEWKRDAVLRLNRRMEESERSLAARLPGRWTDQWAVPAFAAAMMVVCVAAWIWWRGGTARPLRPADVIAQISRVEQTTYLQPVVQTFAVEIAEIRPARRTVKAKLEVWADHEGGRFASRFSGDDGAVRQALWRPSADTEFVYRAALSPEVRKQSPHREEIMAIESLADYGLDPAELERAFLHWLESRSWNPISFASNISSWASEDGSVASAERLRANDGTAMIRITAQRKSSKMVAVLTVDVDSKSYWPRLQTIRFETDQRAIEFRLAATSIRPVRASEMSARVFLPEGAPVAAMRAIRPVLPQPESPTGVQVPEHEADLPAIDPRAVEAQFVLHQAGACLGEAVRVSEDPDGSRVDRLGGEPGSYRCELGLSYVLNALSDLRRDQPAREGIGPRSVAIRHAWALRRLGEQFPAGPIGGLPASSRQTLETVLRDHVDGVRDELGGMGLRAASNAASRGVSADWRISAGQLFELLSGNTTAADPDLTVEGIGRRLDAILRSFSVESKMVRSR